MNDITTRLRVCYIIVAANIVAPVVLLLITIRLKVMNEECVYDEWNISVVICEIYVPHRLNKSLRWRVMFCRSLYVHLSFFFMAIVLSSFFGLRFLLPLWYLQTHLMSSGLLVCPILPNHLILVYVLHIVVFPLVLTMHDMCMEYICNVQVDER
jgi:hypothetical protein